MTMAETTRPQPHFSGEPRPLRSLSRSPFSADLNERDIARDLSNVASQVDEIAKRTFSFGPFCLLPTQRLLLESGKPLRLGSRALDILITLVERPGELVSKEELMARVWPNMFVEPANLTVHVAALRRVLGDGRAGNRYLVNIPGRGYRFVASVSVGEAHPPSLSQTATRKDKHNLPTQVTRLVGRAATIRTLAVQLSEKRFLTIIGAGGIGKTSVALALAEELAGDYEHGVWLVDLTRVSDPHGVAKALATALGLKVSSEDPIPSLLRSLHGKQMLLVFDSCEHVLDAAASLTVGVLRSAPGTRILATSREPLRAEGENSYRLPTLQIPPLSSRLAAAEALRFSAVELFVQRAAARLDDFELVDADVPFVVDLCRKLDGIALAIEFAAARIDTLGVRRLSARLQDSMQLLTVGYRTALPRHQTLRAMLDWSFDWLPEAERVVLSRLSVFAGEFALEAASMVAAHGNIAAPDVASHVANLVTKSLVAADIGGEEPLYRLLETTRAYALEKLHESGEFDLVARHHLEYVQNLAKDDARQRKTPPA
jgi:predicted ATPase/DNA-binding winged helix-turn-helix (wHTH) protein